MKRTAISMVAILFCSAIALGCIEEKQDAVRKFVDFVASPAGKAIFRKHGFTAYPNEKYEDKHP